MCLFRNKFGGVEELLAQKKTIGEVAFLKRNNRYIYYLITKKHSFEKPTYKSLKNTLKALRKLCLKQNVKHLAIPAIGCGLDCLNWDYVKFLLYKQFRNSYIDIDVYHYQKPNFL